MKQGLLPLLFALVLLPAGSAMAEQKKTLGDWDVHYIVLNTPFLTPDVAKSYGIVRSKFNALVNISVLDKDTGKAQRAALSGSATNLIGTKRDLSFKKVEEGDAIYYLAVLPFRDAETYRFNVDIQQGEKRQTLTFSQKMYVDE
ncbi:DUF4426 domain-containing protein [Alteromonas lipolytica]